MEDKLACATFDRERITGIRQIDMGCATLLPIRSSKLASVMAFNYSRHGRVRIEDKAFPACNIHATTAGAWTFHGKSGVQEIDAGTVTSGLPGEHFGCAHSDRHPNSGIIAVLFDAAIDEDVGPLFGKQALRLPNVAQALIRAANTTDDDDFDSQVFEVFHWFSKTSLREDNDAHRSPVRMQRAKRFIEQNALEQVGLDDIAAAVGLNPFVCVRQFKEATGVTPYAYLVHRRMAEAKRLLRDTNLSVERIAKHTGYADTAYFCRSFKRISGVTPTQYRG